ncbi:MAG TPA: hypothetical protein VNQ33_03560 [Acidimicrobiales bacterium]|nr:hypothetical protein [Acidimicrobiales bacterium]
MTPTQRILLAAAVAAFATAAAACGTSTGPEAIDDPRPTTTAASPPTTDPAGGDEIVWQEFTGGGFTPAAYALGGVPDVTIYADGRILRSVDADADTGTLRPVDLEEAQIPAGELAAFLDAAADSALFEPGTDFGQPGVTDLPSTSVTLRTGDTPQSVDVYALDLTIDPSSRDVTPEQAERRDQLKDLLAQARSLAKGATPYVPGRVRASLVTSGSQIDAGAAPRDWPGPPLSAFPEPAADGSDTSCLVVEGPDAATVIEAAADNQSAFWRIGGEVHQIVTAPLVPGEEGCPPR